MEIKEDYIPTDLPTELSTEPQILHASTNVEEHSVSDVVSIEVVASAVQSNCDLWIAFKKQGTPQPIDYLNQGNIDQVLTRAIQDGINVDDPVVMLSDTSNEGSPYRVLLCNFPEGEFREKVIWDQELCRRILNLKVSKLGIYFSDVVFGKESAPHDRWVKAAAREFLIHFIASVVEFSKVKSFKVFIGDNSYNDLLNSVLMLKQDLESKETGVELTH